jgi:hypothetical protein
MITGAGRAATGRLNVGLGCGFGLGGGFALGGGGEWLGGGDGLGVGFGGRHVRMLT